MQNKKLKAEPVYIVNGKKTDAPFHDSMLSSVKGQNTGDILAVKFAIKHGWKCDDAIQHFVESPALRKILRMDKSRLQ